MKRMIRDGDPLYLPEEIIHSILKRLPVKSLIRFQCVCKHWKNLFKTSSFIADHLPNSHQNPFLLYECDPFEKCDPWHLYLVDRKIRVCKIQNAPWIPPMGARIVDSSNGLLCVTLGTTNYLLVYNLAIREVRLVLKPFIFLMDEKLLNDHVGEKFYLGFGFSPIVNDYRIVRVRLCPFFYDVVYGAEVFSGSTGSWKKLEVENLKGVTLMKRDGFSTDGAIFWFGSKSKPQVAEKGENDSDLIVSFDIAMEVFRLITMPPIHYNSDTNFTVYENKLAVLYPNRYPKSCLIELWVLEEATSAAGERERWSWIKKYTSNPYPCSLLPKTIWRNQIVCKVIDAMLGFTSEIEGEVEISETKTIMINLSNDKFNIFVHPRFGPYHCIFNHVESLVPVHHIPN